jgi:hypothetical protein
LTASSYSISRGHGLLSTSVEKRSVDGDRR